MNNKTLARLIYGGCALLLLITEVLIALFIHDDWIRPYGGDLLVTVLLCCLVRVVLPNKPKLLPLYVFGFALLVELIQLVDPVALLGLNHITPLRILVGNTFSVADIICYAFGCLLFWGFERLAYRKK